jgi:L-serine/L-threonine ammonia-lyase
MTSILAQQGASRFISSSGGNAGIAAACVAALLGPRGCLLADNAHSYCGSKLGLPVTVVVPSTASARASALCSPTRQPPALAASALLY